MNFENNMFSDIFEKMINHFESVKDLESTYTGKYGEYLTQEYLNRTLSGNYKIIKNVCIPSGNKFTELDMILIHEKGIFVFESKNYSGWIFGNEDDEKWCQTFPSGDKYLFYNPIKQNEGHCNALSKVINIKKEKIRSYIVFSERCTLKKVPKNNEKFLICKRSNLPMMLKLELDNRVNIYNNSQLEWFFETLTSYKKYENKSVHQKYVKMYKEGNICPKCGRKLVVRKGRYNRDDFIGCSGYPNCNFTRKITSKDLKLFDIKWDIQFYNGDKRIL